jgi:phosphoglycolate phosphatase-like HAD superfamily hydrolase
MRRLILWDIDGTLLRTGGAGRHALEIAAVTVGELAETPHVHMSGKTDPLILREILTAAALPKQQIDGLLPKAMRAAETALAEAEDWIRRDGFTFPGVREALERLAATDGVRQTLVTGNLAANAAVKVATFGLEHFFDFEVGAYGTDHEDRNELVPIALERVERLRGETYAPDEVWVIGDTDRDLACARAASVRCLLVGNGDTAELAHLDADAIVEDLSDTDAILELLLN